MKAHGSLYETITNDIIAELEKGVAPWVKPWTAEGGGMPLLPYNATSQRRYQGVNVLILWRATMRKGYRSGAWLSYRQALGLGGHVRRGEQATAIVYASTFVPRDERDKAEAEQKRVPFLKRRDVFNVEQTEGLPSHLYQIPTPLPMAAAIDHVEAFLHTIGADVRHGGTQACYIPALDCIALPVPEAFNSAPDYYATSLHEHAHWAGAPKRLNRDLSGRFGEEAYAAEELIAELAAAYLGALLSIPGKLQHAEYLGAWLKLLHHDQRAIFTAAARATEAARYLEEQGGISVPIEAAADGEDTP